MSNMLDIAKAYWRLEKWVSQTPVKRKIAAEKSLRTMGAYLEENGIKVIDLEGQVYDPGLAVDVLFREEGSDDGVPCYITETMSPIIMKNGAVEEFGQVSIGSKPPVRIATEAEEASEKQRAAPEDAQQVDSAKHSSLQASSKEECGPAHAVAIQEETPSHQRLIFALLFIIIVLIVAGAVWLGLSIAKLADTAASSESVRDISTQIAEVHDKLDEQAEQIEALEQNSNDSATSATPTQDGSDVSWFSYEVKAGDSLWSICEAHGIDFTAWGHLIAAQSGITNMDELDMGQLIMLPNLNGAENQ